MESGVHGALRLGLVDTLLGLGITVITGVPCSTFTEPLRQLRHHPRIRYVPAANEGIALATACGAWLGGARSAVIAQNSGFGNMVNPLTSLVLPYEIPTLVLLSMRGWPAPDSDEPQHRWMGPVVPNWLESLGVAYWPLREPEAVGDVLGRAGAELDAGRPAFVLVARGALERPPNGRIAEPVVPTPAPSGVGSAPGRDDLVAALREQLRDEAVFTTTGYLSRAMHHGAERPGNFYMQGSMGHASALALGAALASPHRGIVVLDGDGAFLMHMGALATVGHAAPANLTHIVFDNGVYESTGGQPTSSSAVDLEGVARACGYRYVARIRSTSRLSAAIRDVLDADGPALLVVQGQTGGAQVERASKAMPLPGVTARFSATFRDQPR